MRTAGFSLFIVFLTLTLALAAQAPASQEAEIVLGKPSSIRPSDISHETIALQAGTRIRQQPQRNSPVLEILNAPLELPVLDSSDEWVKVRYGSWQGWVETQGGKPAAKRTAFVSVKPDENRLLQARALMTTSETSSQLGPFRLYTDVENTALLEWFSAIASNVVDTYRSRFSLDPGSRFEEAVVLFSKENTYRRFESEELRIARAHSRGYSSAGIAVLFTGSQPPEETVSILIHELTHLLNRRVFGAGIPPWLEEGLAEDLAYCQVDDRGHLELGTLTGQTRSRSDGSEGLTGPRAHLANLLTALTGPTPPTLSRLQALDWEDFLQPESRSVHYAESAFLIRLLLDDSNEVTSQRFVSYLSEVAASELVESISVWRILDTEPNSLEPRFFRFLTSQASANGVPQALGRTP